MATPELFSAEINEEILLKEKLLKQNNGYCHA
jgi:hypothetical protein